MYVYAVADEVRVQVELRSRSYCTCAKELPYRVVLRSFVTELMVQVALGKNAESGSSAGCMVL